MLADIVFNQKISIKEFKHKQKELQSEMFNLQKHVWGERLPLIIVLEGLEAAGKGTVIAKLVESLDPRYFRVIPIFNPTREEKQRPFLHRFWLNTPSAGEIYIFDHSWYQHIFSNVLKGKINKQDLQRATKEVNDFERTLYDNNTHIIKFWFHISEKEQKRRLTKMEKSKNDRWRVTKNDWKENKNYNKYVNIAQEMITSTNTTWAPWQVIPCNNLKYGQTLALESIISFTEKIVGEEFRKKALEFIQETSLRKENN